ncbi:hypothetical protein C8R44DRAFT_887642 [Mycena epipterygia]|nr:hypothetical protein C8R44DRAFT_887642 [Mycena epipterygia]
MAQGTPSALILDSTPGNDVPPIRFLYGIFYVINTARENILIFDQLRAKSLSPDVLPTVIESQGATKTTSRMDYSKVDKIAEPAKIKAHLEEAKQKGFDVSI